MHDHVSGRGFVVGALGTALWLGLSAVPSQGLAQTNEELRARIEAMEKELQQLKAQMAQTQQKADAAVKKAEEEDDSLVKWHLSGYASANFTVTDSDEEEDSFGFGQFSPVFHFQYDDFALFEAEPEITIDEDGETEIELEYAQIDLMPTDYTTFVAGKMLSPVGQFQERLHPAWVNKLPNAPVGFGHGGIQPLSDVGVQVRGGVPLGGDMTATYALAVGNGPRGGHHGVELEGFADDNNSNKAIQGRIGFLPFPYLEVGGSFMFAKVLGEEAAAGPVTNGDFTLWGIDAAFTKGPFDIRGEFLSAELDSFFGAAHHGAAVTEEIPKTDWTAWYVQAAYQLSGLTDTPILRNFEPVIRYGQLDIDGAFEGDGEERFNIGLNYLFGPSIIGKFSYEHRDFDEAGRDSENRWLFQIAYGF